MRPAVREKKKSLCDSESLSVVQQKTHVRLISWFYNQSEIVKGDPPLIGRGPDIPVRVCALQMCHVVLLQFRQRERWSNRDARSVANLVRFSAFFFKKVTSDKSTRFLGQTLTSLIRVSLWSLATARDQRGTQLFVRICSVQWGVWEGAAQPVQLKQMLLLFYSFHANIAEITAQNCLCLSYIVCIEFIRQRLNKLKSMILCRPSLLGRESWLKGLCFSHYFIFIPFTEKRNSKINKVKQFIENLAALKYSMSTERQLDRTEQLFFSLLLSDTHLRR